MKYFFAHLTESYLFMAVYITGCSLLWLPDFFIGAPLTTGYVLSVAGTYMGMWVNALVLMSITWDVGVTKNRSALAAALYILFTGCMVPLHTMWKTQLVVAVFQAVLFLTLKTYHKPNAVQESFLATMLLCLAGLVIPDILLFIPIVWVMLWVQRSFNLKVWMASLIGAATILLYVTLFNWLDWIHIGSIADICARTEIQSLGTVHLTALIVAVTEGLLAICYSAVYFRDETHNIQAYILCFIFSTILASIMMFFPPKNFPSLLTVSILSLTYLLTYYYHKRHSVLSGILFILHTLGWLTIFGLSLYYPIAAQ